MRSRFQVPSPAMVVACVALVVAAGGTSYAAIALPRDSVGTAQLKPEAVTSAKIRSNTIEPVDLSSTTVHSLTAAYGNVPAAVSGGPTARHNWNGAVRHTALGVYCLSGFAYPVHNVVVSVDATSPDLGATAQGQVGSSLCPGGTQVEVQTYQGTARANEPFDFVVN